MLTIYRASAGAGKTHKLTGEYLMLLFSQPGAYRRILAVTFTNKATDEMKTRIVQNLSPRFRPRVRLYPATLFRLFLDGAAGEGAGPEDSGRYPARLLRL